MQNKFDDKKINEEIDKYHDYLEQFETGKAGDLEPELARLRNHIFFVHSLIESLLNTLVVKDTLELNSSYTQVISRMIQITPFLDELAYTVLLTACNKRGFFKKSSKEYKRLLAVNNHRRVFAHPNAHYEELEEYRNPKKYLSVLKELVNALEAIKDVISRPTPKLFSNP